ncbi:hypothetical protein BCV72DRAFT_233814 [Rhizopus microsporus var. microsporus]|uniref:Uncharacterized protein n=2 Tax=Rhizopus microsporus TaxID=58291 RepID=A0A2G4SHK8_RHIZD|nr:uncharacterized protein RHIMIDRAFT_269404 [Rhizopus microsporus ATCC 52813]ORE02944.1 hypothetical protein BCV72DRAFT_233814 [Rhizopus microsporus var. microsporus]PHZ08255.1 hypothetical protein RHIMIDRAFT_269404 [Rhizopus microsporus ATCC 52813]
MLDEEEQDVEEALDYWGVAVYIAIEIDRPLQSILVLYKVYSTKQKNFEPAHKIWRCLYYN